MRPTRHPLKQGWVYLLTCLFCITGYSRASIAAAPPMLNDVRLVRQDERWHVVIRGSDFIMYKATKTDDPLQLVVDFPETVSNTVSYRKILDNEIVDSIDVLVLIHSPQPKTRVLIGLKQDISYQISQSREEIRVSFGAPTSLSRTDSVPDKSSAESVADVGPTETRQAQMDVSPPLPEEESGAFTRAEDDAQPVADARPNETRQARMAPSARLPEEKSGDSAMADEATGAVARASPTESRKTRMAAIPRSPEKESESSARNAGESRFPPASRLLEIRAVEVEEKLIISFLANGSLHDYLAYHLTNPSRLVVDIMGIQSTKVKSVSDFGGPLIDKIRIAPRPGRVRVIFHLVPQLELPYQVVSGNDRLQISFSMNELEGSKTPATPADAGISQKETEALYHQVTKGDTLFSISRRYGLTVEQLRRLNDLEPETRAIYPDQILLVRPRNDS